MESGASGIFNKIRNRLKLRHVVLGGIFFLLIYAFTALPKTFTVVDAETGKPIEGAVAFAWWIGSKGPPGFAYGYTEKVVEQVTDKDGKFTIPAFAGFQAINPPDIKIYKRGYVGWNSKRIFTNRHNLYDKSSPITEKRMDFQYKNGQTISLKPWLDSYSHLRHESFIRNLPTIDWEINVPEEGWHYRKAIEWESLLASKERDAIRKQQQNKEPL